MTERISLSIDGREIQGGAGESILSAAEEAGIYIPRLCHYRELAPYGSCRVCTVMVNGRPQSACTTPIAPGMIVENASERLLRLRRNIVDMLFVEGNHFCMFCEKSGQCELQAVAYRLGITAPRYPYRFPQREVDASHSEIFLDRNRCILCARCVRASRDLDGKHAFGFVGRGAHKRIAVNSRFELARTKADSKDKALEVCPVGALLRKRIGYVVPVGRRLYDHKSIGSEIEAPAASGPK